MQTKLSFSFFLKFILTFVFVGTIICGQNIAVYATEAKGLTLSPLRTEIEIAPGTVEDGYISVTNSTESDLVISLKSEEFNVTGQKYDYVFKPESDVAKWITFSTPSLKLAAGQSQNVKYQVGVPLSAEPGGRYISMFASNNVGDASKNGVSTEQRIASLLYVTVTGNVTKIGKLVSLTSPWMVNSSSAWSAAVQDSGTTHYRSYYSVKVQNIFGGAVFSGQGSALILPGTVRLVSDALPLPQIPGVYKAIFNISLGDTPEVTETRYMLYMPPLAIAVVLLLLIIISSIIYRKKLIKIN